MQLQKIFSFKISKGKGEVHWYIGYDEQCRYNTFSGYPPEIVKKMPKKDLAEEVICSYHYINIYDKLSHRPC